MLVTAEALVYNVECTIPQFSISVIVVVLISADSVCKHCNALSETHTGINVNIRDNRNTTPLMLACEQGQVTGIQLNITFEFLLVRSSKMLCLAPIWKDPIGVSAPPPHFSSQKVFHSLVHIKYLILHMLLASHSSNS